jgi:lysyl-tRNA synthetase class 2
MNASIKQTLWRPATDWQTLRLRAELLSAARTFFRDRNVVEVETPLLCAHPVTDPCVDSIPVEILGTLNWLRTSPEYHMKRLLAAGADDIYQIGKAFRAGERGTRHQPEFTMIEWYRHDFSLDDMVAETCELITTLSNLCSQPCTGISRVAYRDAFRSACGLDPLAATIEQLRNYALGLPDNRCDQRLADQLGQSRNGWLDFLVSTLVHPTFTGPKLWVIDQYPAEQAMLARLDPNDPSVAARFEVFYQGVELANGFVELADANEQAARFEQDRQDRREANMPDRLPDESLIAALRSGLPDCSGVAVGLDRVLMVANNHADINATISFIPGA